MAPGIQDPVTQELAVRMISIVTALRPRRLAALALLAFGAAGCADSSLASVSDPASVPQSAAPYTLATVNGKALPVEMRRDSSGIVTLVRGEMMLGGSTFWQRLTLLDTPPVGLAVSRTSVSEGAITVSGTKVHFRASDGAEWDGTASPWGIVYAIPGTAGPVTFSFLRN